MAQLTCSASKTDNIAARSWSGFGASTSKQSIKGNIIYDTNAKTLSFTCNFSKSGNGADYGRWATIDTEKPKVYNQAKFTYGLWGPSGTSTGSSTFNIDSPLLTLSNVEISDFPLTLYFATKTSFGGGTAASDRHFSDLSDWTYNNMAILTGTDTVVITLPAGLITYYKNDGTTDNTTQTIIYGEQTTIYPSSTFSRDGYSFSRWNTAASGGGTNYYAGASITPTSSMDLWAIWAPLTYTITYDYNDSTRDPFSVQGPYDSTITLPSAPTRTGYTFVEWNTASDGSGTGYAAGVSYTIHGNETLYAIWSINSYTITYNIDGTEDSYTVHYGTVMTLPIPTKPHHRIDGWNTKADGSGIMYEAGSDFTVVEDITLYAIWIFYDYLITFYHNDGTGRSSEEIVVSGNTIKILNVEDLKQQGYTRYGYQLLYWTTNVDGTGTKYMADAVITPTASMDLYAQWTEKPHGIVKLKQSSTSEWEDGYYRYKNGNSWIVPRKIYVKIDGVWRQIIQRPDNGETISVVGEEN